MDEFRVHVASVELGSIAFVCRVCKYHWGMHTGEKGKLRDATALLHALKHVQEEHFHQQVHMIVYHDWLVEAVQTGKGEDNAELAQLIKKCTSIYRALPHCLMRKCTSSQEVQDALEWARLVARMR